mgnify:CR=1 FL=1
MEHAREPRLDLAERVLPAPLYKALRHVFGGLRGGCALAGGSALAGFYAGNRRSDDLDIFADGADSHGSAIRAVKSMEALGGGLANERRTPAFYRASCSLDGHSFTADVVLDPRLFQVGRMLPLKNGIVVADLKTLLMMKSAALVSRCSEKDLYDLIWILGELPVTLGELVGLGRLLDAGVTAEGLLISVAGAKPEKNACGFSLDRGVKPALVHRRIESFRKGLLRNLALLAKDQPVPPLAVLIEKVRRLAG